MSDYFPFWMFMSVIVVCVTWYNIVELRQPKDDDE